MTTSIVNSKYYRMDVTMKNGFKYSSCCLGRLLAGAKKSAEGHWTESVEVVEVTHEDYLKFYGVNIEDKPQKKIQKVDQRMDRVLMSASKKSGKIVGEGKLVEKKSSTKKSSLENFFESSETGPENKKLKKRV